MGSEMCIRDRILSSHSRTFPADEVASQVDRLIKAAYKPHESIRALMKEIVPEYREPGAEKTSHERVDSGRLGITDAHINAPSKENTKH